MEKTILQNGTRVISYAPDIFAYINNNNNDKSSFWT